MIAGPRCAREVPDRDLKMNFTSNNYMEPDVACNICIERI